MIRLSIDKATVSLSVIGNAFPNENQPVPDSSIGPVALGPLEAAVNTALDLVIAIIGTQEMPVPVVGNIVQLTDIGMQANFRPFIVD